MSSRPLTGPHPSDIFNRAARQKPLPSPPPLCAVAAAANADDNRCGALVSFDCATFSRRCVAARINSNQKANRLNPPQRATNRWDRDSADAICKISYCFAAVFFLVAVWKTLFYGSVVRWMSRLMKVTYTRCRQWCPCSWTECNLFIVEFNYPVVTLLQKDRRDLELYWVRITSILPSQNCKTNDHFNMKLRVLKQKLVCIINALSECRYMYVCITLSTLLQSDVCCQCH